MPKRQTQVTDLDPMDTHIPLKKDDNMPQMQENMAPQEKPKKHMNASDFDERDIICSLLY